MATARKLPSGSWRVRVYAGDGKYVSITAETKRKAEYEAARYNLSKKSASALTFQEASDRYIDAKRDTLSPNTIRGYRVCQERLATLSNIRIDRITSEIVQKTISDLSLRYAPKTVKNTVGFVTAVFKMFQPDTVFHVKLPDKKPQNIIIPSDDDIRVMLSGIKKEDLLVAVKLAAFGSLRAGEICALQADCVFDDNIRVRRSYVLDEYGVWSVKDSPKTYAGFRDVPLPADIISDIRDNMHDDGFVVHYKPTTLSDAFHKTVKRLGLPPFRFHSLRHYFATWCHANGIPDQYIMKIGGWGDRSTLTRIYQHTMPEKMEDVTEILLKKYDTIYDTKI